jgi:O-antigen/teichoic acid export membrane protein
MNEKISILKNTSYLFIGSIFARVFGFLLIVLIGREFGDVGLGQYAFSFAMVDILGILSEFGVYTFVVREVAKNGKLMKKYIDNYLALKIFLMISFILIYNIMITQIFDGERLNLLRIASLCYAISFLNNPFYSIYQAKERMEFSSILHVITSISIVVFGYVFISFGFGIEWILWGIIISHILSLLINYLIVCKIFYFPIPRFDFKLWKLFIEKSWPFFFSTLFNTLYFRFDTIMLTFFKGDSVTGLYNAAYKLVSSLSFIPMSLAAAIYPILSKTYLSENKKFIKITHTIYRALFLLILPITVGTIILSNQIIVLIFGETFIDSSLALSFLIIAEFFVFFNILNVIISNSIGEERNMLKIIVFYTLFNIIFNAILIPRTSSYTGAAGVTIISAMLNFTFGLILIRLKVKNFSIMSSYKTLLRAAIASGVMAIAIIYFFDTLNVIIKIIFGTIIYFITLLFLKEVNKSDWNFIKEIVYNKNKN